MWPPRYLRTIRQSWPTNLLSPDWLVLLFFIHAVEVPAVELPPVAQRLVDFERDVRPIFEKSCYSCHGPTKQRSSFRLDNRKPALAGGELGVAIIPGKSAESPLIRYVAGLEDGLRMPPEGSHLSPEQIGILRRWIDDGAAWPETNPKDSSVAGTNWWSLLPINRPALPAELGNREWTRTPIDSFILARLNEKALSPSAEADRTTLIRRLTFDLHGLPPTPEEVSGFIEDPSPNAYERLVDRLLSSPRYGERWARHWLDIAHYADSHGQDQDRPRPNAWPYRDYVIRAFNSDKPYPDFLAEQVAGDVLHPEEPAAIVATGFLAAGPWDESALRDIREDSLDRLIAQYLDRDDIVNSTMSTFVGMTVGCARCHDHKFDPISQEDYYSLQAVFAGIDKAERSYDADPAILQQRDSLQRQLTDVRTANAKTLPGLLAPEREAAVALFEKSRGSYLDQWKILEPTEWKSKHGSVLKALLDRSILALGTRPDKDTYVISLETNSAKITGLRLEVLTDETLPHQGPGRQDNGNLHLSEIRVRAQARGEGTSIPVVLRHAVADFNQTSWGIERALDGDPQTAWGIHPAVGQPHEAVFEFEKSVGAEVGTVLTVELDQMHGSGHLIGRFRLSATTTTSPLQSGVIPVPAAISEILKAPATNRNEEQRAELARWVWEQQLARDLAALPRPSRIYCGTNRFVADGSFRPVTKPRPVHVLTRGEIQRPKQEAEPGSLQAITLLPARFPQPDPNVEGTRRAALANWLVDKSNPLTWRTIVNRVWHYHFGKGIVDTPNDLGKMGGVPSHPELLDWLAADFRDQDGSLKELHRLIVTSSVYRQRSQHHPAATAVDADNRLLSRMNRGRLDAESLRDAVLAVSGRLNQAMYGPPVMHFVMKPGIHVTPEADYEHADIDSAAVCRRSIYRFIFRTRPDPWLDVLDCPDASQSAPVRNTSVSPFQALTLWNNKFTLKQSEKLAEWATRESNDSTTQVQFVAMHLFCRPPTAAEQQMWSDYSQRHGLPNLCRVLFNSSEFLFID